MCGFVGIFEAADAPQTVARAIATLRHRGPDDGAHWTSADGRTCLSHRRLSIIDLTEAGRQPMVSADGRHVLIYNGEIYNYVELRRELEGYEFHSGTDSEVVLAAFQKWGAACLERFIGMFAFAVYEPGTGALFAARDRFGVKPLFLADLPGGGLAVASEIKALHAAGVAIEADPVAWAAYLADGASDAGDGTFWQGIRSLPAGHALERRHGANRTWQWYDVAGAAGPDLDARSAAEVSEEYTSLLVDAVRLRFRSDVPVGINVSGGLDSSTLLAAVHAVQGEDSDVSAFTFVTGDPSYDELPWVNEMLTQTKHPSVVCRLRADDVPSLAADVQWHQDEPFGGIPTLAYACIFEHARQANVTVLLDGQGMDEQWAGYDYYRNLGQGAVPVVQGTSSAPTRPGCLSTELRALAEHRAPAPTPFADPLRDTQVRDLTRTKLPRALRFNERVSMRASRELREPFLDHRLVELALRQPPERKISATTGKVLLRSIVGGRLPGRVVEAPKRPMQTPQREWLRGPLRAWVTDTVEAAIELAPEWFIADAVRRELKDYFDGNGDNSFFIWQWISAGLLLDRVHQKAPA
jgi:asparagine synthase (glutamine-hydrolysing)